MQSEVGQVCGPIDVQMQARFLFKSLATDKRR